MAFVNSRPCLKAFTAETFKVFFSTPKNVYSDVSYKAVVKCCDWTIRISDHVKETKERRKNFF